MMFSNSRPPCGRTAGCRTTRAPLFARCTQLIALIVLATLGACGGGGSVEQGPVANRRPIHLGEGGMEDTVEVGDFGVDVRLDPSMAVSPSDLTLNAQFDAGTRPSADGSARVTMNTDAVGLIQARLNRAAAASYLIAVVPKGPSIRPVRVELSVAETAASLVFLQPGIATDEPIAAQLLLDQIRALPETGMLATVLAAHLQADPNVLESDTPPIEVMGAIGQAVRSLLDVAASVEPIVTQDVRAPAGGHGNLLIGGLRDSSGPSFFDVDCIEADRVAVTHEGLAPGRNTFQFANTLRRWVLYWLDPHVEGSSPDATLMPVAACPPRARNIPGLSNLLWHLGRNAYSAIRQGGWTRFIDLTMDQVRQIANPDPEVIDWPLDLQAGQGYELKAYGMGQPTVRSTHVRGLAALALTVFTQLADPLVSIVTDVRGWTRGLFHRGQGAWRARWTRTVALFESLVRRYVPTDPDLIARLISDYRAGRYLDALNRVFSWFRPMLVDPELVEFLSRHWYWPAGVISRAFSNAVLRILNPLTMISRWREAANFALAAGEVIYAAFDAYEFDMYQIKVEPHATPPGRTANYSDWTTRSIQLEGQLRIRGQVAYEVQVVNQLGDPITGLNRSDFAITETINGTSVCTPEITRLDVLDESATAYTVLVLDRSGSMAGVPLADAQAAACGFVDRIGSRDRVMVIAFDDAVTALTNFTSDQVHLKDAIEGITDGGSTAIYDAANRALTELAASNGAKAIVLLTDGEDNSSTQTLQGVIDRATQERVVIHTIGLGSGVSASNLSSLAQSTGGGYYPAPDSSDLDAVYQAISDRIQGRYILQWCTCGDPGDAVAAEVQTWYENARDYHTDRQTSTFTVPDLDPRVLRRAAPPLRTNDGTSPAEARAVSVPSTTPGEIAPAGSSRWYRTTLGAGRTVTITTSLVSLSDSYLELFDSTGTTRLAYNDDGGPGLASRIVYTASGAQEVLIRVRAFSSSDEGAFTLTVE